MSGLIKLTVIINVIQIILFIIATFALFYKNTLPKTKADIATINAVTLLLYCICFLILFIAGFLKDDLRYLFSVIFILMPFVIGKFVRYQTLKKYSILQLLMFCISLFYLLKLYN